MTDLRSFACMVIVGASALSACTHVVVLDRLDTYVASSFADRPEIRPDCIRYVDHIRADWRARGRCRLVAGTTPPGKPIQLHLYAVNSRDLRTPQGGKQIKLAAVDRDGVLIPGGRVTIAPETVMTDSRGRNAEPITVVTNIPGDYRIRLTYPDRAVEAVGFSPVLHVISSAGGDQSSPENHRGGHDNDEI